MSKRQRSEISNDYDSVSKVDPTNENTVNVINFLLSCDKLTKEVYEYCMKYKYLVLNALDRNSVLFKELDSTNDYVFVIEIDEDNFSLSIDFNKSFRMFSMTHTFDSVHMDELGELKTSIHTNGRKFINDVLNDTRTSDSFTIGQFNFEINGDLILISTESSETSIKLTKFNRFIIAEQFESIFMSIISHELKNEEDNSHEEDEMEQEPIVKPPRKPSAYNVFMKAELAKLSALHPEMGHKEKFMLAASNWKISPMN